MPKGYVHQPIRLPGQFEDELTGIVQNRFREYLHVVGSYLAADPTGLRGGLNSYRYTLNPIGYIDPLGLSYDPVMDHGSAGDKEMSAVNDHDVPETSETPSWQKNSGTRRFARRRARAARGSSVHPELEAGVYPVVIDSFSITALVANVEAGDMWVIDRQNEQVLHYVYGGGGPGAGFAGAASREFGAMYLPKGGSLEGISISGETDGVLGFGGTGTLSVPTLPMNPLSTSVSGGPAVGFGAGLGGIGTYTKFQKVYDFSEVPSHVPLGK